MGCAAVGSAARSWQSQHCMTAMRATCVSEYIHMRFTMLEQQVQANILVAVLHAMKQTDVLDGICASGRRCRAVEDVIRTAGR